MFLDKLCHCDISIDRLMLNDRVTCNAISDINNIHITNQHNLMSHPQYWEESDTKFSSPDAYFCQ